LAVASPRLWWSGGVAERLPVSTGRGAGADATLAKHFVWEGVKDGGNDPSGTCTRIAGCDPLASLVIEAV